jgi:4-diphosphocytidyl-2-C-methyl-D-erythritol kinase
LVAALSDGDIDRIAAGLGNDLQPAALSLAPQLHRTLEAGNRVEGVLASLISGSGPTWAFLCADAETATMLAATLETQRVCRTARAATGPAPGASVVA